MAEDEAKWRRRLLALTMARLGGLAILLVGVAVFYSDVLRDGGWPQVGAILIVLGALDALLAPWVLRKSWEKEDR